MSAVLRSLPSRRPAHRRSGARRGQCAGGPVTCASTRDRTASPHASGQPARPDRSRGLPARDAHRRRRLPGGRRHRRRSPGANLAGLPVHRLDVHDHGDLQCHSGASCRRGGRRDLLRRRFADHRDHAPTGQAVPVDGGYRVTGQWTWNTAGVHSNWFAPACVVPGEEDSGPRLMLLPTTEVEHQDNWRAAGMAGTATNIATVTDVFVPAARTILIK